MSESGTNILPTASSSPNKAVTPGSAPGNSKNPRHKDGRLLHIFIYVCILKSSCDTAATRKKTANLKKHGLDFDDARDVIESTQTAAFEDKRFDYGEARYLTLGLLHGEVVIIATAETDKTIRIISMRKAGKYEQKIYYENC